MVNSIFISSLSTESLYNIYIHVWRHSINRVYKCQVFFNKNNKGVLND